MRGLLARRTTATRLALAGEAAHVFPPIGAQGLNLGLRDIADLRDCLADSADPGAERVLAAYGTRRTTDVASRTWGVDLLNRSLLSRSPTSDFARGAGLRLLSHIGPLRRLAMREGAMPRSGKTSTRSLS